MSLNKQSALMLAATTISLGVAGCTAETQQSQAEVSPFLDRIVAILEFANSEYSQFEHHIHGGTGVLDSGEVLSTVNYVPELIRRIENRVPGNYPFEIPIGGDLPPLSSDQITSVNQILRGIQQPLLNTSHVYFPRMWVRGAVSIGAQEQILAANYSGQLILSEQNASFEEVREILVIGNIDFQMSPNGSMIASCTIADSSDVLTTSDDVVRLMDILAGLLPEEYRILIYSSPEC